MGTEEGGLSEAGETGIDPAALLAAVVATAVAGVVSPGAWTLWDSLIGVLVGAVLTVFYVWSSKWPRTGDWQQVVAVLVLAVVVAVTLAYSGPGFRRDRSRLRRRLGGHVTDCVGDRAVGWMLLPGVAAAGFLAWVGDSPGPGSATDALAEPELLSEAPRD